MAQVQRTARVVGYQGSTIEYRVFGEGALPVVLVHGWMVSGAVFDDLVENLDLSGLRVVVPNQRGTGGSSRPDSGYGLEAYAADIRAVADAEALSSFVCVGHSMGGQVAQWVAAEQPGRVKGLVLLNSVPASGMPLPEDAKALFRTSGGNRTAQGIILGLACKQLPDAAKERLLDDAGKVAVPCVEQAFDAWTRGGFEDRLGAIRAPTLALGTDDPFLPPAFLRAAITSKIAGARLAVLPGPGHYPQVERPRETAAILESFLAGMPR